MDSFQSKAIAVYNLDDGEMIFGFHAGDKRAVASLTKIMTAYLAAEELDFKSEVTITAEMLKVDLEFVTAGYKVGQKVTVEELMHATLLPSAADSSRALAIATAGSIEKFVEKMNSTATKFELKNTHFSNTYGLDKDNYSTAEDIAKLISEARKNEKFRKVYETNEYFAKVLDKKLTKTVAATAEKFELKLGVIKGAKTGFTDAAGRCLGSTGVIQEGGRKLVDAESEEGSEDTENEESSANAEVGDAGGKKNPVDAEVVEGETNLAVVALGAEKMTGALEDSLEIYDFYATNYARQKIAATARTLAKMKILGAKEEEYVIQQPIDVVRYLPLERSEIIIKYLPAEKLRREGVSEEIRLANGTQEQEGVLPEITSEIDFREELGEVRYELDGEVLYSFIPTMDAEIHYINYPLIITGSIVGGLVAFAIIGRIAWRIVERRIRR